MFEETRRALHVLYEGRRLITVADDVSLPDTASLALLGYLLGQGTIFLIATRHSGDPVAGLVTGLWRHGRVERVDVEDLSSTQLEHASRGRSLTTWWLRPCWRGPHRPGLYKADHYPSDGY